MPPNQGIRNGMIGLILASIFTLASGCSKTTPKFKQASIDTTKQALMQAEPIAAKWHEEHSDECPTIDKLKGLKELSPSFNSNDAWGKPITVDCSRAALRMISSGPDGKDGTDDDIVVP